MGAAGKCLCLSSVNNLPLRNILGYDLLKCHTEMYFPLTSALFNYYTHSLNSIRAHRYGKDNTHFTESVKI